MFDCKKFDKLEFHAFDIETEGCTPCQARAKEWTWVGCMLLPKGEQYKPTETYKVQWGKVGLTSEGVINPNAKQHEEGGGTLQELPDLIGLELPKHLRSAPPWLAGLTNLRRLRLNHCAFLADIPLGPLEQLDAVEWEGSEHAARLLPERRSG